MINEKNHCLLQGIPSSATCVGEKPTEPWPEAEDGKKPPE